MDSTNDTDTLVAMYKHAKMRAERLLELIPAPEGGQT